MTEEMIRASIINYGRIIEETTVLLEELDSKMSEIMSRYTELVKIYNDSCDTIQRLATEIQDKERAAKVMSVISSFRKKESS